MIYIVFVSAGNWCVIDCEYCLKLDTQIPNVDTFKTPPAFPLSKVENDIVSIGLMLDCWKSSTGRRIQLSAVQTTRLEAIIVKASNRDTTLLADLLSFL
jgi:hypothetical protein